MPDDFHIAVSADMADLMPQPAATPRYRPGLLRRLRLIAHVVVALLPNGFKIWCYRFLFRFSIGRGVRIGLSILDVGRCTIGEGTRIGHFNVFTQVDEVRMGDHVRIGFGNLFRGGSLIDLGRYSEVLRLNQINAILEPDCVEAPEPVFVVAEGSVITAEHRFDFTDRIDVGRCTVIGGRNSSFWTHNREATLPIHIGSFAYVGSEVRFAPGARVASWSIVGLGSVVTGAVEGERSLIAGVPARVLRPLTERDIALIGKKTRKDLPHNF